MRSIEQMNNRMEQMYKGLIKDLVSDGVVGDMLNEIDTLYDSDVPWEDFSVYEQRRCLGLAKALADRIKMIDNLVS